MICLICNLDIKDATFSRHIKKIHNIEIKDYYDKYLKIKNEDICPTCGKITSFINYKKGYAKHCNQKCANNDPKILLQKKETCIKHFGVSSYLKTKDARDKCIEVITSEEINNKRKKTMLEKYGNEYAIGSAIVKQKINEANQEKYGVNYPFQSKEIQNKANQTLQQNYGVTNPYNIPEIQQKANCPISREKMQKTTLKRYGVNSPLQAREVRLKGFKTMKKNGNYSSYETLLEQIFIKNKIKYEIQYNKDSRYPFHCDFYLPEKDLFIEINGWWHHGHHWFNSKNKEDLKTLKQWEEKAKINPQYQTAINVWTKCDVEKRNYAKNNKLNYVVLWNLDDIKNWINSNFEIRSDY